MSNTELLLKKVEGLPPGYMPQIFDFIDQLKHQAPPPEKVRGSKLTHEEFAKDLAELRQLCKDSTLTVDRFLEMRHEETEREEAEFLERLKNLDTPLRRKYPTLISMIGSCKGLDTMDAYFERKAAEKERERRQERRYEEEEN